MRWLQLAILAVLCWLASYDTKRPPTHTNLNQSSAGHDVNRGIINTCEQRTEGSASWCEWHLGFQRALSGALPFKITVHGIDNIRSVFRSFHRSISFLELPGAYAAQDVEPQRNSQPSRTGPAPSRPHPSSAEPYAASEERNMVDSMAAEIASLESSSPSATPGVPTRTPTPTTTPTPSPSATRETFGESLNGCDCLTRCATTFDTLVPWCEVDRSCDAAKFDGIRRQFWDQCALSPEEREFFSTFIGAWSAMVTSAIIASSSVYFLAGIQAWRAAFRSVSLRSLIWLPIVYALYGAATSFVFSSLMSLLIVQMYLAMPYAIPTSAAYALGAAQGCFLMYSQLDRWYSTSKT
eukprot:gb/GECG01014801.1/.p1 GENE.gb/GECG01014801.1/~~gb/GECG01014801.1/.p1  ORF type:complete len:352 (+),score=15.87 gb/GECG01014801.1/:1-1056(+)